jgi:3-hydroxyacyl-CoA dehydrogenase/enoyl-CoA hydratase/3-hydroxybutyryl-CoA epimerase
MTERALRQEQGNDGVLVLTLDVPGEKLNTLGRGVAEEMRELLAGLERRGAELKGVVIQSGKPDSFIAGADIKEFIEIKSAIEGEELSRGAQRLLDRIEALSVPVVAAIHGTCLGGGLELCLACRYRIASDHPKTTLGLPEVMIGLIPGAGGTQRLPRQIGLPQALEMILTGRTLGARRALSIGLVDQVVPAPALLASARRVALLLAEGGVRPRRRRRGLVELSPGRRVVLAKARTRVLERTGGHYPAPLSALDVIDETGGKALAAGLETEARHFGELSVSGVSRSLVSLFFATQEIKKEAGLPEGTEAREVTKLGVLGAGLMGSGIAAVTAQAGIPVRLKDSSREALGGGLRRVREVFEGRRRRGSLSERELQKVMERISPTLEYTGFRRAELVIEAVLEDLNLKRRVLAETEAVLSDQGVFASNTSSIPIGEIALEARRPERVLGMHFFSPVHKMTLLEVVVTRTTDATATATAVAFGRRLGKHVIVVWDGPGFYTTRTLSPFLNEAARLLEEGASIEAVDGAMTRFGFTVGPIELLDQVGIDVAAKVAKVLHKSFGERHAPPSSMTRVLDDGRLGRKNRRGFYTYGRKQKRVDASVYDLLPSGPQRGHYEPREIQDRLVFAFLNEAVLCLQQGVLRSPRDGDVGAVFGLGFPPFLGGPFRYLDHLGARFAMEVLERLRRRHGERFRPADRLLEMAKEGRSFHP